MRDHNYQSRMKNCHVKFTLTVDNEKSLCEKKKSSFEIIDWVFSEPVSHYQSAESILAGFSLILKMAEQLSPEDFTEFIDFLTSIVERTASVYRASDHVGLEICAGKLEQHTRMLIAISLLQNFSLGDLFEPGGYSKKFYTGRLRP